MPYFLPGRHEKRIFTPHNKCCVQLFVYISEKKNVHLWLINLTEPLNITFVASMNLLDFCAYYMKS